MKAIGDVVMTQSAITFPFKPKAYIVVLNGR